MFHIFEVFGLPVSWDIILLILLLIIGIIIIIVIAKIFLFFFPAAIIALVVWLLTKSLFWAGVAFLIIAFISILRRR